jgi:hypothetical protein
MTLKLAKYIPGWGTAIAFLCEIAPQLYAFIMNQILQAWQKSQAESEDSDQFKPALSKFTGGLRGIKRKLTNMMRGIRRFTPPAAIPGLVTPHWEPGQYGRPEKAAIYKAPRTVNLLTTTGTSSVNYKKVNAKLTKDAEKGWLNTESYFGKDGVGIGVLASSYSRSYRLENIFADYLQKALALHIPFRNRLDDMKDKTTEKVKALKNEMRAQWDNIWKQTLGKQLSQKYEALDKYEQMLRKRHKIRFENVTGPLYNYETGWNKAYVLTQSDLMSAIPPNIFEDLHEQMDIPLGQPCSDELAHTIGIPPFQWKKNEGTGSLSPLPVFMDPINYEIQRVRARKDYLRWIFEDSFYRYTQRYVLGGKDHAGNTIHAHWRKRGVPDPFD